MATCASLDDGKPQDPVVQDVIAADDLEPGLEQPTAPDQFDENYRTTKYEIWAYYACVPF